MDRSHNKVADGLADLTMDHQLSWEKHYNVGKDPRECNIIVQTDGGRRTPSCAAASMVVGLFHGSTYEPWYAKGIYIATDHTVFQTEAIALEAAVSWLACSLQQQKQRSFG